MLAAVLRGVRPRPRRALNVVTTTEDLAAIAREVGGDKVTVDALAKGYQDPHFVEAKPSFILKLHKADLLIAVGRELEIGWLPPLITQSRNAKIQPGADGYLDASLTAQILEIPTGQITRAMGDVHPQGNPHYWLDPGQRPPHRAGDPGQAVASSAPGDAAYFAQRYADFDTPAGRRPRSAGRRRWRPTRAPRSSPTTARGRTSPSASAST